MPLYEYECKDCGHRFERIQKFSDPLVTECPSCGKESVEQMLSAPAVQFKGSGWYVTDYAGKGKSGKSSTPETKSETKTESKTETKPDSSPSPSAESK